MIVSARLANDSSEASAPEGMPPAASCSASLDAHACAEPFRQRLRLVTGMLGHASTNACSMSVGDVPLVFSKTILAATLSYGGHDGTLGARFHLHRPV